VKSALHEHMVERMEPLAKRLVDSIASHLCDEVDRLLARVEEAFDLALSATLSQTASRGG